MGADLIIDRSCEAKRALGDGDPHRGTLRILAMKKSRSRAMAIAGHLQAAGESLEEATVSIVVRTPEGEEERQVTVADLLAESAPLEEHAGGCAGCPANRGNEPYGCFGYMQYPVPEPAERWLAERLQPADTLGGHLLLKAIDDFGYDGAPMRQFREMGLLEADAPAWKTVKKGWLFGGEKVSSEQVLQAIFAVGDALDPMHCALVLMWLGALEIDGEVPASDSPEPLRALTGMADAEVRAARTRLVADDGQGDPGIAGMRRVLDALYGAFVNGVPLRVDA